MDKKITVEECKAMAEHGTSLEVIHKLHGPTITCPVCEEKHTEEITDKK
jgi:hypothetical protein